jgi:predicted small metal-binding protein
MTQHGQMGRTTFIVGLVIFSFAENARGRRSHRPRANRHKGKRFNSQPCATKREGSTPMKTMTCRQLGGPCDHELRVETADQVIKDQDRHIKQAIKDGDATHEQAREDMKNRWKHPKQSMDWYSGIKKAFAELAED